MISERFNQLLAGAQPREDELADFDRLKRWKERSDRAMRAVQTKKKKYTKWPSRRNDHKEKL